MALHLITGYAGTEHITSADQGAYNMGTYGEGEFVLDRGNKLGATVVTNNSITIADGEALMQGRFIKLPVGTTESVTIDNGTSGMKRKDLIVLRYSKDAGTGIESVALAVKKGTPDASSPSDPAVTTGTITDGTDLVNEMKLYRVNIDGLNITAVDTLFSVKTTMVEYMDEYQLPVASTSQLGGIKIANNSSPTYAGDGGLYMNGDILRVRPAGNTSAKRGGVYLNSDRDVTNGLFVYSDGELRSYKASADDFGTVKVGAGLGINNGVISALTPDDAYCNALFSSITTQTLSIPSMNMREVTLKSDTSVDFRTKNIYSAGVKNTSTYSNTFLGVIPYNFSVVNGQLFVYAFLLNLSSTARNISSSDLRIYYVYTNK